MSAGLLNIYGVRKRVGGGVDHSGMEDMEMCHDFLALSKWWNLLGITCIAHTRSVNEEMEMCVMIFKLCQKRGICSE